MTTTAIWRIGLALLLARLGGLAMIMFGLAVATASSAPAAFARWADC